jgi:hypothetical protein
MDTFTPASKSLLASLAWLFDGYRPQDEPGDDPPVTVRSPQRVHTLQHLLAVGDVADAFVGRAGGSPTTGAETPYLLKTVAK